MNIKDFAEKFFKAEDEAWYKGDFLHLKELEDPNVVYHLYPPLPDMVGHEAHVRDITNRRQAVSDYKQEWQFLTGDKNLYALSLKSSFRITGERPGSTIPLGKKISTNRLCVGRVKKGKLVEAWVNGSNTVTD